ncbi:endonuclease/exonuclease/phosphatase family protein [Grimontia marina]|uniref:Endonuclease/Exonuclease/phosphatase family protein n=1 Tax=Grimontia marina TaxID=646534 RepID=A0A128FGU1_9GAMM|nr:endonuclease/exonuclease/phosphatase family protein [Grimontia marina]CZF85715.1 Endonuclease/Exonuclease/phosphatase family protein [Grimontia marina]
MNSASPSRQRILFRRTIGSWLAFVVPVVMLLQVSSAYASLSVATWNMEWLSDKDDIIQSKRTPEDYLMMQTVSSVIDADLIAFQEVDSETSLAKVLNPDEYDYYFSDRSKYFKKSRRSQQFTGWAVKKGIKVIDHQDYQPLSLPTFLSRGDLRYGAYIEVVRENQPSLHLLSIHLKSGCFETPVRRNNSCKKLDKQIEALGIWINARIELGQEFVIAGDFNHYMNEKNEWVWKQLIKEVGEDNLVKLTHDTDAKCKARKYNYRTKRWEHVVYRKLIDHIVVSPGAVPLSNMPEPRQYQYSYHAVATYRLSDHCPVIVDL